MYVEKSSRDQVLVLNVRLFQGCKESYCKVRGEAVQMFAMCGAVTISGAARIFITKY